MLPQRNCVGLHHSRGTSAISGSAFGCRRPARGQCQIRAARSKERKDLVVKEVQQRLDTSLVVFGYRYKGLKVPAMQRFRRGMPEGSNLYICKNTLMKVALQDRPQWSAIGEQGCKGENAWVFVHEDVVADSVKHFFKFEEELIKEARALAPKGSEIKSPVELSCIVMDSKVLSPADLKRCESLPNKKQLYATIARLLKQPAKKIATGVKLVPTKLAIAIKKISELDEDKSKSVAEFAKS